LGTVVLEEKWPVLGRHEQAAVWLHVWADLGRAPRTMDAYARGLAEYLEMCERVGVDPLGADRAHIASYVRELAERPSRWGRERGVDRLGRWVGECHAAAADGSREAVL
jgi:integrase/recombinase XerD